MTDFQSWGRFPNVSQTDYALRWRTDAFPRLNSEKTLLPRGLGRSYGDVCLNDGGILLSTHLLNHFIEFNTQTGCLTCEAGVSLAEILQLCVPRGWFLPTTPGTKFVTLGGAIANDVHGKNHHRAGTFGRHVQRFELLRSSGERLLCSPTEHEPLFKATIGGLGLTGLITWAEIQLRPIVHRAMHTETVRFANLTEFLELSAQSDQTYEYTMAWVDCNAQGSALGRGIFFRGNHITEHEIPARWQIPTRTLTMPMDLPSFALNRWTVQAFNFLYYNRQRQKSLCQLGDYDPFFYPLDAILKWNRLYGKRGFLQYQCVVPYDDTQIITEILQTIAQSGLSSFLAVLKTFGDLTSPGLLSYPRKGVNLALDFPLKGFKTFALLARLDEIVSAANGSVNPSKDARLSARHFQQYYPNWETFSQFIDPRFSSSFWRRVTLNDT